MVRVRARRAGIEGLRQIGWYAAGVGLLVGVGAVAGCGNNATLEAGASDIAPVVERSIRVLVEATGYIEPIRIVEVKSKASGEILAMHIELGDEVERGTLLVEVDPRDVRNQFAQAEADLEVARANLEVARSQLARQQQLQAANVVTQQEYENAALNEARGRSELVRAEVNLELAHERLSDVTIRAPINGTVILRDVEAGQIITSATGSVSEGTTLMKMADLSEMQVRMLVDETDLGRVSPGQMARVVVDAYPDRPLMGQIIKIEPQATQDESVTMFPVLIHIENRDRLLRPGMTAQIEIEVTNRQNVVAVPNQAIVGNRDLMSIASLLGVDEQAVQQALRSPNGMLAFAADVPNGDSANIDEEDEASEDTDCQTLLARVRAGGQGGFGEINEADRERLLECREQMPGARAMLGAGGQRGAGPGGARQGGAGAQAGGFGGAEAAAASGDEDDRDDMRARSVSYDEPRSSVVFVAGANGSVEPRGVVLGVNDWDYTEVLQGLNPGERVVLISVARLQAQQRAMTDQMRQRNQIFPTTNR